MCCAPPAKPVACMLLEDGGHVMADIVPYATGSVPNVRGLGLEAVGVAQSDQGAIMVDANYLTNVPNV